jgi:hypothetical protein
MVIPFLAVGCHWNKRSLVHKRARRYKKRAWSESTGISVCPICRPLLGKLAWLRQFRNNRGPCSVFLCVVVMLSSWSTYSACGAAGMVVRYSTYCGIHPALVLSSIVNCGQFRPHKPLYFLQPAIFSEGPEVVLALPSVVLNVAG